MQNLGFALLLILTLVIYLMSQVPPPAPDREQAIVAQVEAGGLPTFR